MDRIEVGNYYWRNVDIINRNEGSLKGFHRPLSATLVTLTFIYKEKHGIWT